MRGYYPLAHLALAQLYPLPQKGITKHGMTKWYDRSLRKPVISASERMSEWVLPSNRECPYGQSGSVIVSAER